MACTCMACNHIHEEHPDHTHHNDLWSKHDIIRFSIAAAFFATGIMLKAADEPLKITIQLINKAASIPISPVFFIGAWLAAGIEVIQTLLTTTGKKTIFDENFLMTFATVGAFILGEWTEGAAVMLFYNLGELLQAAAVRQSRRSIINLMDLRPEYVRLYRKPDRDTEQNEYTDFYDIGHGAPAHEDACCCHETDEDGHHPHVHTHEHGNAHHECNDEMDEHNIHTESGACRCQDCTSGNKDEKVPPEHVPIGTLILVKAGEKVPIDGILIEGACSFDTSSMTGESVPRVIESGEIVLAGFVNIDGLAVIKTTVAAKDTAAAKMLQLVETAQDRKAKAERLISRFARIYTPLVTISAAVLAILPPLVLTVLYGIPLSWSVFVPWISRGLVFLVISCPCAFVISVPLGYFGGLGGAAKKGILIKGADFIDTLAKTDCVIFDKTGTLTTGDLTVQHVIPAETVNVNELYELAAIAEYHSKHPIAYAIKHFVQDQLGPDKTLSLEKETTNIQGYSEKAGRGVAMIWKGKQLAAGSAAFILGDARPPAAADAAEGTKIFLSYGGCYVGCIICNDSIKPQSIQAVKELRKVGISYLEMLTGDSKTAGEKIAAELQLDCCSCELLPHQKVARFEALSTERKKTDNNKICVFVGDGINDAPVLARADVGIAMGGIGSDAAIEAADVVLMNDNPQLIPQAIISARFTRKIVMQNIILSFAVKIAFLLGGALGTIGLWAAVFADVGVALLAVCNSLRARR